MGQPHFTMRHQEPTRREGFVPIASASVVRLGGGRKWVAGSVWVPGPSSPCGPDRTLSPKRLAPGRCRAFGATLLYARRVLIPDNLGPKDVAPSEPPGAV